MSQSRPDSSHNNYTNRPLTPKVTDDMVGLYPSLYGQPSYCSIFSDAVDFEPGPGQYEVPHSLGNQCLSARETAPSMTILSKHASSWGKVFISKQHAVKARDTPGPGTYLPQLLHPDTSVRFGTDKRKEVIYDTPSPGPIYDIRLNVTDSAFAKVRFGKDQRFAREVVDEDSIGPGQYNLDASFDGRRGLSKSFSVGHRAYDKVRFPGSEKVNLGRCSPGPGQFRSWQPCPRRCAFPRSKRKGLHDASDSIVGPGSYSINSISKNHSHAFGRAPAKARFSWKTTTQQMDSWCRLGMAQKLRN